jgi:hypothetical protein
MNASLPHEELSQRLMCELRCCRALGWWKLKNLFCMIVFAEIDVRTKLLHISLKLVAEEDLRIGERNTSTAQKHDKLLDKEMLCCKKLMSYSFATRRFEA